MPVTVRPWAKEGLRSDPVNSSFSETGADLLYRSCGVPKSRELLKSSYSETELAVSTSPTHNGLVQTLIQAYAGHHHVSIRPDDVWLAILTQFSFYVNAHAEDLRGQFVTHEGKKELVVEYEACDRKSIDYSRFVKDIAVLIEKHVVDASLRSWVTPAFSTTTRNDIVVASVMLMGTLQEYFSYTCERICGYPSVTLLGERADYELILHRLEKLTEYGPEPTKFAMLLRPVLRRFIRSFDDPQAEEVIEFWRQSFESKNVDPILCGSTPTYSGWITAFCFWDSKGKPLYYEPPSHVWDAYDEKNATPSNHPRRIEHSHRETNEILHLTLDGVKYHLIGSGDVPPAQTTVKIIDGNEEAMAEMIAGSLGIECTPNSRAEVMADGTIGIDSMQPSTGWWLYEKPPGLSNNEINVREHYIDMAKTNGPGSGRFTDALLEKSYSEIMAMSSKEWNQILFPRRDFNLVSASSSGSMKDGKAYRAPFSTAKKRIVGLRGGEACCLVQ